MNAYWKLSLIAAYSAIVFFAGWHIHTWEDGYKVTYQLEAAEKKSNTIDADAQKTITTDRVTAETVNTEAENEVSKNPIPCKLPSSWVRTYNNALAGSR